MDHSGRELELFDHVMSITNYSKAMVESMDNCCRTMDSKELVWV